MTLLQPHDPTTPWRTYRILRGEQGVFGYEPYKSILLPLWRFKTPAIARESSNALWKKFMEYEECEDFVGMDMCRKFLQMGMTRSKRYAGWKGGRKYEDNGEVKERGGGGDWAGRKEKEEASLVFREVWERVKGREGYVKAKGVFLERQRGWDREEKEKRGKIDGDRDEDNEVRGDVKSKEKTNIGDKKRQGGNESKSESRKAKADEVGEGEEKDLLGNGIKDGDDGDNGSARDEGKCRSKRRGNEADTRGNDVENELIKDETQNGDDVHDVSGQEEGKRRSKRRKRRG